MYTARSKNVIQDREYAMRALGPVLIKRRRGGGRQEGGAAASSTVMTRSVGLLLSLTEAISEKPSVMYVERHTTETMRPPHCRGGQGRG